MTTKEKAQELVDKFTFCCRECDYEYNAKQCAIIAIDEIIIENGKLYLNGLCEQYYRKNNAYLFEVKAEIEKL